MLRRLLGYSAVLGLAVTLSCVGPRAKPATAYDPCHYVYGACVLYTTDAPVHARVRIGQAFERAARHWGTEPTAIAGWTLVIHGYGPTPWNRGILWGVTNPDSKRIDVWVEYPTCPEVVTVHEWGHAASLAAGGIGRPHLPGIPDDPKFEDASILSTLHGLGGCP